MSGKFNKREAPHIRFHLVANEPLLGRDSQGQILSAFYRPFRCPQGIARALLIS